MKLFYKKEIEKEFEIEIDNIKECYFSYLDHHAQTCYVWVYKHSEHNDWFKKQESYIYVDITKTWIDYEFFNSIELWTFRIQCKIKNLFKIKKDVKTISKEMFESKKENMLWFLNKRF